MEEVILGKVKYTSWGVIYWWREEPKVLNLIWVWKSIFTLKIYYILVISLSFYRLLFYYNINSEFLIPFKI